MKALLDSRKNVMNKESTTAYIFIAPFLIGFFIFHLLPIIYCLVISVVDFNGYAPLSGILNGDIPFVGLDNYKMIFTDRVAKASLINTFKFAVMYVPLKTISALALALLLNQKLFLRGMSRSLMLMPYVANVVAIAMVFTILLDSSGPFNAILTNLGFENIPVWLLDKRTSLPIVVLIAVWQTSSYTAVIFLAALQDVPNQLYEAARIDGANVWQTFIKVTLPMISPTTFFVLISNTVGSFMNYALIKNLTGGGPGYQTRLIVQNIVEEAFTYNRYSFATAQAVFLFVIIMIITLIQWRGQKKWVHY